MSKNAVTPKDDERLQSAFEKVADDIERGYPVHDAMVKTASAMKLFPGEISVLATAFNTGRQLSQFDKTASIFDQLKSYELADAGRITDEVYPSQKTKSASAREPVASVWSRRLTRTETTKVASEEHAPFRPTALPAFDDPRQRHDQALAPQRLRADYYKQAREVHTDISAQAEERLAKLRTHFEHNHGSFGTVEKVATHLWGECVSPLFELLAETALSTYKRANQLPDRVDTVLDERQPPLLWIDETVKLAQALGQATRLLDSLEVPPAKKQAATGNTCPECGSSRIWTQRRLDGDSGCSDCKHEWPRNNPRGKQAAAGGFGGNMLGSYIGTSVGRVIGDGVKDRQDMVDRELGDLDDAGHMADLKKIRTNSMLAEMLNDPDDPISGHDPQDVAQAYNEIAAISPRVAEQKILLRPMLAKSLQGRVQPFEVKEMTGIEKDLYGTQRDPSGNQSNP